LKKGGSREKGEEETKSMPMSLCSGTLLQYASMVKIYLWQPLNTN